MNTGTRILIFGVLGLFCCPIVFSTLALIQANQALSSGTLEDSERGMVNAGKILGIIGLVLMVVGIIFGIAGGGLAAALGGAAAGAQ